MNAVGLITGASSGIGRALAHQHALRGRDLVIVARRRQELDELAAELTTRYGIWVRVIDRDLTSPEARQDIYHTLRKEGVTIDYLFNNAGFGGRGLFHEQDWSMLNNMIQLNITAVAELTRLFLPGMVERGRGRILNTSSTAGFMPGPLQSVYFATKAFVNSFSKGVASELEGTGVTVTALCPGAVKTEFADTADMGDSDLFKGARTPEYTAKKGYEAMEAGKLDVITETGLAIAIRGLIPFVPTRFAMNQIKKIQS